MAIFCFCCNSPILYFVKLTFAQKVFFKTTFTQKLFQTYFHTKKNLTYFHTETFSNLLSHKKNFNILSHRNFFKLTFTQKVFKPTFIQKFFQTYFHKKVFQTYFHRKSLSNLLSQSEVFQNDFHRESCLNYFHTECFSNLLSHIMFVKLTFTQNFFVFKITFTQYWFKQFKVSCSLFKENFEEVSRTYPVGPADCVSLVLQETLRKAAAGFGGYTENINPAPHTNKYLNYCSSDTLLKISNSESVQQ